MNRQKAMFICRGSIADGLGHVIRSRRLADVMRERFEIKMAILGDDSAENLLIQQAFDFTITTSEDHLRSHIRHFGPDFVVFDLVTIDDKTFDLVRSRCRCASLSPIFNRLSEVDIVFHRTSVKGQNWPQSDLGPIIRAGLEFAIISDHCRQISEATYSENLNHETLAVAISMGGADAANKTLAILERVKDLPEKVLFWVMLGEGYAHSYEELVRCVKGSKHEIILAKTNDSMWRILNTCSLVILAGGTTTYEAVYAGIPSINTLETEDHFFLIQELVEKGACVYAGYTFDESLRGIRGIVSRFVRNRKKLFEIRNNTLGLIDGNGAKRIAEEIAQLYLSESVL